MPIRTFDLSSGTFRAGNPGLSNSAITNYDLSARMEMSEDLEITVSVFHKTIADPIVDVINVSDPSLIQYINGNSGVLTGAEVEAELRNLGPFTLSGNVTYIDATLTYPVSNAGAVTDTVVGFPFQPEWITNLNLEYANDDIGLTASLIYNFTGEYATTLRSLNTGSDVFQNAQHGIDLVVTKKFGDVEEAGLELKLGVKNLWATDRVLSYAGGRESVDGRQFETIENERVYFLEGKYSF
jgi:outer membrane receptor for ferrienterochelin and colicin